MLTPNKIFKMDCFISVIYFLTPQILSIKDLENYFSQIKAGKNNSVAHAINGNMKLTKINVMHANKGSADLVKKIDIIMSIIKDYSIDIMCITEANYDNFDPIAKATISKSIKGYKLEVSGHSNLRLSRCIMII